MPRANRHHISGHIWHITHRCHKKEFLLKFAKDRRRWRYWLFEAKKRYGLSVLNYNVTSNHVHLLVCDTGNDVIPKSMQLIAGRTAQEYNQRKGRKGAYWEDRYHTTAIDAETHLAKCFVYIDLNMVRAGVVHHPAEWADCGYHEVQQPPKRYSVIDIKALLELFGCKDIDSFQSTHRQWIDSALEDADKSREPLWSESIAVGGESFIIGIKEQLGVSAKGRNITETTEHHILKEPEETYSSHFSAKRSGLSVENMRFWNKMDDITWG